MMRELVAEQGAVRGRCGSCGEAKALKKKR